MHEITGPFQRYIHHGCGGGGLPLSQAVEQLSAGAQLLHQHQVAGRDVGGVQLHQVAVVEPLQDQVLPQHHLPLLRLVRGDLGRVRLPTLLIPALGDDTKTTPGEREGGGRERERERRRALQSVLRDLQTCTYWPNIRTMCVAHVPCPRFKHNTY